MRRRRFRWFYDVHEHQHTDTVFHNEHKLNIRRAITTTDTKRP